MRFRSLTQSRRVLYLSAALTLPMLFGSSVTSNGCDSQTVGCRADINLNESCVGYNDFAGVTSGGSIIDEAGRYDINGDPWICDFTLAPFDQRGWEYGGEMELHKTNFSCESTSPGTSVTYHVNYSSFLNNLLLVDQSGSGGPVRLTTPAGVIGHPSLPNFTNDYPLSSSPAQNSNITSLFSSAASHWSNSITSTLTIQPPQSTSLSSAVAVIDSPDNELVAIWDPSQYGYTGEDVLGEATQPTPHGPHDLSSNAFIFGQRVEDDGSNGGTFELVVNIWSLNGVINDPFYATGVIDLPHMMTHEIGHTIGLKHNYVDDDVMDPELGAGAVPVSIGPITDAAVRYIYPGNYPLVGNDPIWIDTSGGNKNGACQ